MNSTTTEAAEHLVLVDGSYYLYRAFHAMPAFSNAKGEPTGALYGVGNMLRRLLGEMQPDFVAVVFDARGKTFRDELYAQYKANRPSMPEELAAQVAPIHELLVALGLSLLEVPGVEADDVIGTLCGHAVSAGMRVTLSTGDKDMAQLVNDRVTMVNPMDGAVLDPAGVVKKFGVPPERIVDYLTLVGDAVDNVPGVPKVGPKTALKWLGAYGSLDVLLANAGDIKGKVGENLRESFGHIPLSRHLVTIKCDVVVDRGVRDLERRPPNEDELRALYSRFEFNSWLAELESPGPGPVTPPASSARYETVLDEERFSEWLERLRAAPCFAFDTETTSLDYMRAEVVGVSFAVAAGEGAYVPLAHSYPDAPAQLGRERVLEALRPLLEDPERPKVGQNLKYDMSVLANHGVRLRGVRFDTMLESYVVDSTATRHDMDALALRYLDHRTIHFADIAGKGAGQLRFDQIPIEQAGPYAAEDAEVTLRLHETLWPRLEGEPSLRRLFEDIEMPLVPVLSKIERCGVRVDVPMLERQSEELAARMEEVEREAHEAAGAPFNLGSPKQIQRILYDQLGLPVRAKTPKGQPSTAESVLQELAHDFGLPRLILAYRAVSKLRSTYTGALPACVNPRTGRVHTSYHQAVASTGRLSSSDPNLQNIPIRTAEGRRVRQAFVPEEGWRMVAADYSQIELRIMAHLSGDEGLQTAFASGADIHRATAAEVFGLAPDAVGAEHRRRAKAINFGLIYGMSAFGLGRQLGIGRNEAQAYVDLYFARYPGVRRFMDETRTRARERGFVETVFGRRLHLPEIDSRNVNRRQYAERTAINAPMQGTAADIIKRAMVRIDRWLEERSLTSRMIMQVHDELVLEVPENELEEVEAGVREHMVNAADLTVPLVVDIGVGANWDEAH